MPSVTYVAFDGQSQTVDVDVDLSVMEGARDNGIDGIDADCGGACACSTCHAYVEPEWVSKLAPPEEAEKELLEFVPDYDPERSRLTCQIKMTDELDGLTVHLPETQL